jgi:uncharacterized glyoxalase superfamily protein PhnB
LSTTTRSDRIVPDGWHAVTPRLVVHDAAGLVAFIRAVFDAGWREVAGGPDIVTIGDSLLMVSEAGVRPPCPAFLHVYVPDADELYRRALAHGATSIEAPLDTPYGDRRCMFTDTWGNTWQAAVHAGAGARPAG